MQGGKEGAMEAVLGEGDDKGINKANKCWKKITELSLICESKASFQL